MAPLGFVLAPPFCPGDQEQNASLAIDVLPLPPEQVALQKKKKQPSPAKHNSRPRAASAEPPPAAEQPTQASTELRSAAEPPTQMVVPAGPAPCICPPAPADESIMAQKGHGTSPTPVQQNLRWGCERKLADKICNYNRKWAEAGGYFEAETTFFADAKRSLSRGEGTRADGERHTCEECAIVFQNGVYCDGNSAYYCESCWATWDKWKALTFYDSNTGDALFFAPIGRSWAKFVAESRCHGWPSFRDEEVNWEFVRCLPDGEAVSVNGTHLGHNLPDRLGNRYCINLVSVAGRPKFKF
eukprot:TRINITY_DN19899_c0_g1_i2.p1 TRINITY_DN19899_c0_g1~~TRINITY_DN19899_c0_g1_i2.p1  ORF type:complete len:314 (-),score=60.95 TRINITY_DN19899_c0_g1_i2:62-958(-)